MKIRELIKSLQKTTPGLKWTALVGHVGTIQWNAVCFYGETFNLEVISSEKSIGLIKI